MQFCKNYPDTMVSAEERAVAALGAKGENKVTQKIELDINRKIGQIAMIRIILFPFYQIQNSRFNLAKGMLE